MTLYNLNKYIPIIVQIIIHAPVLMTFTNFYLSKKHIGSCNAFDYLESFDGKMDLLYASYR